MDKTNDIKEYKKKKEIRLRDVNLKTVREFQNIASHTDISVPDIIKSHLPAILASYPAHIRDTFYEDK